MKEQIKNRIASERGFPSWEVFENFVIDHQLQPIYHSQILMSAMDDVNKEIARQSFLISRNYPDINIKQFFEDYEKTN